MSLLKNSNCKKRGMGYATVIHKRKIKKLKKMNKCLRYLKQWVLRCLPEKKRKTNKIAHVLLKVFQSFNKRDMFQGA